MNYSQWYKGFSIGYEDGANKADPRPPEGEGSRMWALRYMAGYLTACGVKVGTPNG